MFEISPTASHIERVEILAAAGFAPPKPWVALAARHARAAEPDDTATARYARALVTGDTGADIVTLRALALAEAAATPVHKATLSNFANAQVGAELERLFEPHAEAAYKAVAAEWDSAGERFASLAQVVDPETDAARIVAADETTRRAWTDAMVAAGRLSELEPVVIAAAQLLGAEADRPESVLPLMVDTAGCHRRRLWEAWDNSANRCGRWSALLGAGGRIAAHPAPASLPEYAQPGPVRETWEWAGRGQHRRVLIDDCDIEHDAHRDAANATPAKVSAK